MDHKIFKRHSERNILRECISYFVYDVPAAYNPTTSQFHFTETLIWGTDVKRCWCFMTQKGNKFQKEGNYVKNRYQKYGYILKSEDMLVIDEEAAAVVQEIFKLAADGWKIKDIAAKLNEERVDAPVQYRKRKSVKNGTIRESAIYEEGKGIIADTGNDTVPKAGGWSVNSVSAILRNRLYLGEWEKCIGGETKRLGCPPIVEEDLFEKAREAVARRALAPSEKSGKGHGIFAKRIVDKETGWPLQMYRESEKKRQVYRFKYPAPKVEWKGRRYISCEEVQEQVIGLLGKEHRYAQAVMEYFRDGSAEAEKERQMDRLRKEAEEIFTQMAFQEEQLMTSVHAYEKGTLAEEAYRKKREQLLKKQEQLDQKMQGKMEEMGKVEQCFRIDNPWLSLFLYYKKETLDEQAVKTYIDRVEVYRFEQVELIAKHQEWKTYFPPVWNVEA
jgi:hypothetical protein